MINFSTQQPQDHCCLLADRQLLGGAPIELCLGESELMTAHELSIWRERQNSRGMIKCGRYVDATICPNGHQLGDVEGKRELGYSCVSESETVPERGVKVSALQELKDCDLFSASHSVILELHPWDTKSASYLSLDRSSKSSILWDKITMDDTMAPPTNTAEELMKIDVASVFDEWGDELDCRLKTIHSQGNVAKAEFLSNGDHPFTGMFTGADTGFVRLSTVLPVVPPEFVLQEGQPVMNPSMSMKFLRDEMDSANTFGNGSILGQTSYNFFETDLVSNVKDATDSVFDLSEVGPLVANFAVKTIPETNFITSVGLSNFAEYDQYGQKVDNPNWPFSVRYEPNEELKYDDEFYEVSVFDRLKDIESGTMLYKVWALEKPRSLGGEEQLIGEIVLRTDLVTSQWADKRMYFRHQRHDDDFRRRPEWVTEDVNVLVLPGMDIEIKAAAFIFRNIEIHPHEHKKISACPFSFLFE